MFALCFVRGTKRLVSVNICSVEGNSADIFVSKVSPGIFVIKVKWMPIIFGGKKLSFWVRKKPSYHFRKANVSCKIHGIQFCSLQFSIIWIVSYRIRTDQIMLAHTNVPFKGHSEIRESGKLHSKPLFYYFSLGAPALCSPSPSLAKHKTIMPVLQGSVCFYSGNWVKKSDCKAREKLF